MRWLILFFICYLASAEMYIRIDPFMVGDRVVQFLKLHQINNCFERLIGENELHLKCLRHGELVDISLMIEESIYI